MQQGPAMQGFALRLYMFGMLLLHSSSKALMRHAVCLLG